MYVPYESARMGRCQVKNDRWGRVYNEMIDKLLKNRKHIDRIDIALNVASKSIDKMIGRAAHIELIENPYLIKMIIYSFDEYFH